MIRHDTLMYGAAGERQVEKEETSRSHIVRTCTSNRSRTSILNRSEEVTGEKVIADAKELHSRSSSPKIPCFLDADWTIVSGTRLCDSTPAYCQG